MFQGLSWISSTLIEFDYAPGNQIRRCQSTLHRIYPQKAGSAGDHYFHIDLILRFAAAILTI